MDVKKKIDIYTKLVETKLLYGLASVCLTVAQTRQLDGFQARCLRRILRIPVAFISRVPNLHVLQRAGHTRATEQLVMVQLGQLGKVIRAPDDSPMKLVSFVPGTLQPATNRYVRRVGRPRTEWITQVLPKALRRTEWDEQRLIQAAQAPTEWKAFIQNDD